MCSFAVNEVKYYRNKQLNTYDRLFDAPKAFVYLFIWGLTSLSTLYRSYHDG